MEDIYIAHKRKNSPVSSPNTLTKKPHINKSLKQINVNYQNDHESRIKRLDSLEIPSTPKESIKTPLSIIKQAPDLPILLPPSPVPPAPLPPSPPPEEQGLYIIIF